FYCKACSCFTPAETKQTGDRIQYVLSEVRKEENKKIGPMATSASILKDNEPHCADLRIVLLGGRWGGKSSAGNTILGEERFESGRQRTAKSDSRHATVAGWQLVVVDTPGWKGYFSLRETTQADKEEIKRSVCECFPGPHVFLLVVPVDTAFTTEHKRALVEHLKLLGERVWKHSMVLFTCGDWLHDKSIEQHIETEGKALQWLVDKCRNRYHVLTNKSREEHPTQVTELLEKIEEMVAGNSGGHYEAYESECQIWRNKTLKVKEMAEKRMMEMEKQREERRALLQGMETQPTELSVVLLGSRGAGKSASGNTILGSEEFDIKKGTSKSVVKYGNVEGTTMVTLVDTPGWWRDYSVSNTTQLVKQEVKLSVSLCRPGPHIFLLAIDTDVAFTEEQRAAVEEHLQLISGRIWSHTMILFTRVDWLGAKSIEQHIEEEGKALQWLVEKCGNRYHALDNKNKEGCAQVSELLQKMKEMVAENRGCYHEVDEMALRGMEKRMKEVEEKAKQRMTTAKEESERFQGSSNHLPEVRVVLLGQTSSGKNASGTTILGREVFPTCETVQCEIKKGEVAGRQVIIVNSPGWRDNAVWCTMEQDMEIARSLSLCPPGPHVVLLVIPVHVAYTERHKRALQYHLSCFDEDIWRHTMVLFTYGDKLGDTAIEQHIEMEGRPLQWLVEKCGNRYHVFRNKNGGDVGQVTELLEKIEEMVAGNSEKQFFPDGLQVYQEVEEMKRREADEMKACFEEEWRKREKELLEKFRKLLLELQKETGKASLPPKLKCKLNFAPNSKESKFEKGWMSRDEQMKRSLREKMAELDKDIEQVKLPVHLRSSYDLIPPHLSGSTASTNSSSEDLWSEDYKRTYNTVIPLLSDQRRKVAGSPSIFSAALTDEDSGVYSSSSVWNIFFKAPTMHGRVKLKSTAQQEEEKRKEREKKLKVYVAARDACFNKRKEGIMDDEALQLTQQLLSSNPDFATLWNYRREILLHQETIRVEEEVQRLYEDELSILEGCLKVNPKSYGSWHHRGWVSSRIPRPDWVRELGLCDRCLALDDRNFHCWDYRRMVVKLSGPLLHPPPQTHSHRVCEEQLLKEYELVQNAFFTDPNDQSAWFYYRWLLGRAEREEMISCVYVSREGERVVVAFSRPVNALSIGLLLVVDGQPLKVDWKSVHPRFRHCPVWICELAPGTVSDTNNEHNLTVHWTEKRTHRDCALYTGRSESWCRDTATDQELFRSELSVEKTSVLQSELQSCTQLLELEPQNKWCVLTIVLLMRALDPLGYERETLKHFETLKVVDPMRCSYYSDLCSKFMMENTILKMEYAEVRVFSLSGKKLTTLSHLDQLLLVTHINISSNQLQALPPQFAMLQCLEVLEVDDNIIENLYGLYHLPRLEELSLRNNKISRLSDLKPLTSCPKLTRLDLRGNPVAQTANIQSELAELLPSHGEWARYHLRAAEGANTSVKLFNIPPTGES
ncbi:hypothetical protein AAFF_G00299450, partial [Aldrovandia affinis]